MNHTIKNFLLLIIATSLIALPSCSDDEKQDDGWVDFVEDGGTFTRGNTIRFYYMDETGNGLIDTTDMSTLPMSYSAYGEIPAVAIIPDDYLKGYYNGNANTVVYDPDEKMFYMETFAFGDERLSTYVFYVGFKDDFDQMAITYRYTNENIIGDGLMYYAKIISWKINGTYVYSDKDDNGKKVFIKKSNGKTTVSLSR